MTSPGKYITKSIRLTEEEAKELADLVEEQAASESALMRRWVLKSMREFRIERAVAAYQHDEVDLREGAAVAGIPIGAFIEVLTDRHVAILRDPSILADELDDLMTTFGGPDGRAAVREEFASRGGSRKRRRA